MKQKTVKNLKLYSDFNKSQADNAEGVYKPNSAINRPLTELLFNEPISKYFEWDGTHTTEEKFNIKSL